MPTDVINEPITVQLRDWGLINTKLQEINLKIFIQLKLDLVKV